MTYWILILLLITPEGELLRMEQLTYPHIKKAACMELKDYAHTLDLPKGTWLSCQPVVFEGYFAQRDLKGVI